MAPSRPSPPSRTAPDEHLDVPRAALRVRVRRLRLLGRLLHDGLGEEGRGVAVNALEQDRDEGWPVSGRALFAAPLA